MFRKLLTTFIPLFLLPVLLLAQDGKLRGKVTDKESGEPLIGANVVVEGTSLGAATDVNGEYVILSVAPGVYSFKASYIGYSPVTIANVRVSANITATQDFTLSSTAVQVSAVEIIAERPLIQRNTTNTIRMTTQDEIKNLPFRGLQNILALNAGVVSQGGNLYVRGGRSNEIAYYIDGASATNPLFNSENVSFIQEAIEELQLQSGGYTAEFGGANSAVATTTVRTGTEKFKITLDYQTDDFAKPGEQFLGTSAFGYRNIVGTLGGPLLSNVKFYVAGQSNYTRNRRAMFLEPFRFDSLINDGGSQSSYPAGIPLPPGADGVPGSIEFKRNYLYKNWADNFTGQGTLLFDLNPIKLRFTGSYTQNKSIGNHDWPFALNNYFMTIDPENTTNTYFANVRATHVLGANTFYEVGLWYSSRNAKSIDPVFGDDYRKYVDSIAARDVGRINPLTGSTDFRTRYDAPIIHSVINAFPFNNPLTPINGYGKNNQNSFGISFDITSQLNPQWELKAGGRLESFSMKAFGSGDISTINTYLAQNASQYTDSAFAANPSLRKKRQRDLAVRGAGGYGYDVDGNEISSGVDGPREPLFASAYVQNKFEFRDIVVNAGLRFELFDTKVLVVNDFLNPPWDQNLNYFANPDSAVTTQDPLSLVLPRLSFSFPVTDRTVFYAMYGKYAQMPALSPLYASSYGLAGGISPISRSGSGGRVGMFVRPERTTQYEIGIRQTLTDNFAFTVTGFYKDLRDQMTLRRQTNNVGVPIFVAYKNEDFGTTKGLELTLELRRTNRLQAKVNYTISDARGSGSNPNSSSTAVSDEGTARFPNFINPLDFDQTHRGSIFVDYRFAKGDGGEVLEGMGVNFIFTFNSGHAFTKIAEPQILGQSNPWEFGMRATVDPRTRYPVEPINSSTTPWVFNVDMNFSKIVYLSSFNLEFYVNVLNLLNSRQVINVFPNTGTAGDDGWLRSPLAVNYKTIPRYTEFYNTINIVNRYYFHRATGQDIYGPPRQIRVGLKLDM